MSTLEKVKVLQQKKEAILLQNPLYTKNYTLEYITSNSAFNIPYKGIQCDWHQIDMLKNNDYVIHPKNFIGAEDIFSDYGLFDASDFFQSKGIEKKTLCASPIRAILDKLYNEIAIHQQYPKNFDDFNDYMFEDINKKELQDKLNILAKNFTPVQASWLDEWREKNGI